MVAVEAISLTKAFGDLLAVRELSFKVEEGTIFGLLGPNGAGKTTTLRMIYGVLKPTSGTAKVMGVDVRENPIEAKRKMGVLPEDTGVYPRLTAEENLVYFGKLRGMDEGRLRKRIKELLEILSLTEKRFVVADKLSRGQKQKLAFARAILDEPPVLLLDEPTLGVDVMSAREIRKMIEEYARSGKTVILSTHNMWEVERLCDRIAIISEGTLRYEGSKEDLRRIAGKREFEDIFVRLVRGEVIEKAV
ncbi:MAG: ABC transporter ATP-binding protein [Candidatus Korarchaeota archaeon]|nr:ABC transporter ATP-binding protein [Candidatus Korarchaeota archaeon]